MNSINKELRYNKNESSAYYLKKQQIKQKNVYELRFINILIKNNIKFIWQQPFYNSEKYYCVDFYLSKYNIVIEIDGRYHNKKKDAKRTVYLKHNFGIKGVIRFENKELVNDYHKIEKILIKKLKTLKKESHI